MLVITRKRGEGFIIGDDIHVTIVAVNGNNIRIGIDAPMDVPVFRDELISIELTEAIPLSKTGAA